MKFFKTTTGKWTRWFVLNGVIMALLIQAVLTGNRIATNLTILMVSFTTLCGFLFGGFLFLADCLASYNVKSGKAVDIEKTVAALGEIVIPKWLDVSYDLVYLLILASAGWWWLTAMWTIQMVAAQFMWAAKESLEKIHWTQIEKATAGGVVT